MNILSIRTDPFRYVALQYLVIAFSRLRVREEALRCLDDLLSYLAAEPEAAVPEGGTCGELALDYLHDLQVVGRHAEYDFRWLQGDHQFAAPARTLPGQAGTGGTAPPADERTGSNPLIAAAPGAAACNSNRRRASPGAAA